MKKLWLLTLLSLLLLSGCGKPAEPTSPTETIPTETVPVVSETLPAETIETEPAPILMERREPVGDTGNLWYIPNEIVEGMGYPELHMLGENLLVSCFLEDEAGCTLELKLVSIQDGSLLAESDIPCSGGMEVQVRGNRVGLCDAMGGRVLILDGKLNTVRTYEMESTYESWYLSGDCKTLYKLQYETGLTARNLESGQETVPLEQAAYVSLLGETDAYLLFSYVDRQDQRSKNGCLDLETGDLTVLPIAGYVSQCSRSQDVWLLRGWKDWSAYHVISGEEIKRLVCEGDYLQLLPAQDQLLFINESGRGLKLYEKDGSFLSRCALPETENNGLGMSFLWSDSYHGYFFTDTQGEICRLMYWDISVETSGESLSLEAEQSKTVGGTLVDEALYTRAAELSARYGVDIRIAEKCQADYDQYDSYILEDEASISDALDVLERALSVYPAGFLEQLKYNTVETIRIELVGALEPKADSNMITAAAFTQEQVDDYLLAADARFLTAENIYHEITHIIDRRLAWDAELREDALFSEETWLSLQPEGFDYAYSYAEELENINDYMETGYFVWSYACTFPTEDRATMMESAMSYDAGTMAWNPGLLNKLKYYSQCIRDCFDTTGWPETLPWEIALAD